MLGLLSNDGLVFFRRDVGGGGDGGNGGVWRGVGGGGTESLVLVGADSGEKEVLKSLSGVSLNDFKQPQ